LFLQTLNWRHNPDIEKQINASKLRTKQLENEIELLRSESEQIEKDNARLSELNSKLDAIVFSSATNSTPTKSTPSESEM
jgi:uncharacterized protein YPO0396